MSELKACPFCGAPAKLMGVDVTCSATPRTCDVWAHGKTLEEVTSAWNRRANRAATAVEWPEEPTATMCAAGVRVQVSNDMPLWVTFADNGLTALDLIPVYKAMRAAALSPEKEKGR